MSLQTQDNMARDPRFIAQVRQACITSAIAISAEINTTANHTNRANYSKQVLAAPDYYAPIIAQGVANNSTIAAEAIGAVVDSDVQFTVNSIWNAYAGVI